MRPGDADVEEGREGGDDGGDDFGEGEPGRISDGSLGDRGWSRY